MHTGCTCGQYRGVAWGFVGGFVSRQETEMIRKLCRGYDSGLGPPAGKSPDELYH